VRRRSLQPLAAADVVDVLPEHVGSRDITALVAERIVRETLTGLALGRARPPRSAQPVAAIGGPRADLAAAR
jgi:hypothetical protein